MNLSQQNQHSSPIAEAAEAAFPYNVPMIAGFLFLGIACGIYKQTLGLGHQFFMSYFDGFTYLCGFC